MTTAKPKRERLRFEATKECYKGRRRRPPRDDDTPVCGEGREKPDPQVDILQRFLVGMGYLGQDRQKGKLCQRTREAVKHYQKCYALNPTGLANRATLYRLEQLRCGVPDIPARADRRSGPAAFTIFGPGCRLPTNDITYEITNGTPDFDKLEQPAIIQEAFDRWAEHTPLRFRRVEAGGKPVLRIAWRAGMHDDGTPFDEGGTFRGGNVIAHAFPPAPCGEKDHAGNLHFDEAETWMGGDAVAGGLSLLNVATHEIGHLLGLDHSNNPSAVMFAYYETSSSWSQLHPDDIAGIQALYGSGSPVETAAAPQKVNGELGHDESVVHLLVLDERQDIRVQLEGPANADFDLYVRTGVPPTTKYFDARGYTATSKEDVLLNGGPGPVYIMVHSFSGAGRYSLQVT